MQMQMRGTQVLTNQQVLAKSQILLVQCHQFLAVHLERCNVQHYALGDVAVFVAGSCHLVNGRGRLVQTGREREQEFCNEKKMDGAVIFRKYI